MTDRMRATPVVRDGYEVGICFHGIGDPARPLDPGEDEFWISVAGFLDVLDEVAAWPNCRLSFDDGNRSDITVALPALLERGLTATFYPVVARLGERGSTGPDDLRDLVEAGMAIGSHGWSHVPWPTLDDSGLRRELVDAPRALQEVIGQRVTIAAAPMGQYNRRVLAAARRSRVRGLSTSDRRTYRPGSWLTPRFSVRAMDDAASVRQAVVAADRPGRALALGARGVAKRVLR